MTRLARIAICAFLIYPAFFGQSVRADDDGPKQFQGPADLRNQGPFQLLFLAFSPESARVLPKNRELLSAQLDIANNLLHPPNTGNIELYEDTETQRVDFKERRGLGNGLEVSISLPMIWRDGGFTDKLIEDYHHLINILHPTPDDVIGRRYESAYHSVLFFTDADGNRVVNEHPAVGLGDLQGTLKRSLFSTRWTAASIRIGVKAPTGNAPELFGSGGTDFGIDFDGDAAITHRIAFFTNVSYVRIGPDTVLENSTNSGMRHGMFAIEYYASHKASWILQNDISDAGIRTGNTFADGNQATVSLVYKYRQNDRTTWTYGFTENGGVTAYYTPWLANVAPDPTFTIGWETRR